MSLYYYKRLGDIKPSQKNQEFIKNCVECIKYVVRYLSKLPCYIKPMFCEQV